MNKNTRLSVMYMRFPVIIRNINEGSIILPKTNVQDSLFAVKLLNRMLKNYPIEMFIFDDTSNPYSVIDGSKRLNALYAAFYDENSLVRYSLIDDCFCVSDSDDINLIRPKDLIDTRFMYNLSKTLGADGLIENAIDSGIQLIDFNIIGYRAYGFNSEELRELSNED